MRLTTCLLEVGRNAEAVRMVVPLARLLEDNVAIRELADEAEAALEAERRRVPSDAD